MENFIGEYYQKINQLINCVMDLVFVMEVTEGSSYRYALLNQSAKEAFKHTDEIIGRKMEEVVSSEKADFLAEQYGQVLKTKERVIFEYSDKEDCYEETCLNPFFNDQGEISLIIAITRDISDRKKLEKQLTLNELKYKSLVENNSDGVYMLDLQGRFLSLNEAGENLCGYKEGEILGSHFEKVIAAEDIHTAEKYFEAALELEAHEFNLTIFHKSGEVVYCRVKNVPITVEEKLIGIYGIAKDITKEHEMNQVIKRNESYYRTLIDQAPDPVIIIQEGYIQYTNHAFAKLLEGTSRERIFGKALKDFLPLYNRGRFEEKFAAILNGEENKESIEEKMITLSGKTKEIEMYASATSFKEKPAIHAVIRDITERKETERKVNKMAFYDYLTGLPNRQLFEVYIEKTMEDAIKNNSSFALLFIDGDKFKAVNDTLGHQGGDVFIKEFADRLRKSVRGSDTVSRIGGDEFSILLPDMKDEQEVIHVLEQIYRQLEKHWNYEGRPWKMTMSAGIAIFPDDGQDQKTLVRKADEALYAVKEKGGNAYRFYRSI